MGAILSCMAENGVTHYLKSKQLRCEESKPGCFMNCRGETVEIAVPPGKRRELDPRRT